MGRWISRTTQTFFPRFLLAAGVLLCLLAGCEEAEPEEIFGACEEPVAMPVTEDKSVTADPFEIEPLDEIARSGICLLVEDFDGDGHLDIFTVDLGDEKEEAALIFYWGHGDGTFAFERLEEDLDRIGACTYADMNDDGSFDLIIAGRSGVFTQIWILEATSPRTYEIQTDRVEYPASFGTLSIYAATALDIAPAPGPELILGSTAFFYPCLLYHDEPCVILSTAAFAVLSRDKDGVYRAKEKWVPPSLRSWEGGPFMSMITADLNNDGRAEIFVGTDIGSDFLLSHGSNGKLHDLSDTSGLPKNNHAMGLALADFDGDGRRDLFTSDLTTNYLHLGEDCGFFADTSASSKVAEHSVQTNSWGASALDVELDGDMDLFVTNSDIWPDDWNDHYDIRSLQRTPIEWAEDQHHTLLTNDGDAHFEKIDLPHLDGTYKSWFSFTVAKGDLDEDGDEDLIIVEYGAVAANFSDGMETSTDPMILWNRAEHQGHWLSVIPLGEKGCPANGARVTIKQEGGQRFQDLYRAAGTGGHAPLRAHFGLGDAEAPVQVDVRWPDGTTSTYSDVTVDQIFKAEKP